MSFIHPSCAGGQWVPFGSDAAACDNNREMDRKSSKSAKAACATIAYESPRFPVACTSVSATLAIAGYKPLSEGHSRHGKNQREPHKYENMRRTLVRNWSLKGLLVFTITVVFVTVLLIGVNEQGLNAKLVQSVEQFRTDDTLRYLNLGADPNAPDTLHLSIVDLCRSLLNRSRSYKATLLQRALEPNGISNTYPFRLLYPHDGYIVVKALVEHGANVNAVGGTAESPLAVAILSGRPKIACLLLEHGADPNSADRSGTTPLMLAVQLNDTTTVCRLIADHANVTRRDHLGNTALSIVKTRHVDPAIVSMIKNAALKYKNLP